MLAPISTRYQQFNKSWINMFGFSVYRNEKHKWRTLVIFGRHDWLGADKWRALLFSSISVLCLDVILVFYSFRSPTFYRNELCRNAAFCETGKHWRQERRALQCLPSAAFASPPTILPLRVELTRGLDESRDWRTVRGQSGSSVDSSVVLRKLQQVSLNN